MKMSKEHVNCWRPLVIAMLLPGVSAADIYVAPDGSPDSSGTYDSPYSLSAGVAHSSSGDTLVLKNGLYLDGANSIGAVPSGSASAWTTVRAEEDFGATIDAQFSATAIHLVGKSYVQIIGVNVQNAGDLDSGLSYGIVAGDSHHIKFMNCSSSGVVGNGHDIGFSDNVQYGLIEGCHVYGAGRYKIGLSSGAEPLGDTHYIVIRRNVCRFDYSTSCEPLACFSSYRQQDVVFQNNIVIDSRGLFHPQVLEPGCKSQNGERFVRGFFTPNGFENIRYHGNIVLHHEGTGMMNEGAVDHYLTTYSNNVIWDVTQGPYNLHSAGFSFRDGGDATLEHFTIGYALTERGVSNTVVEGASPLTHSIFNHITPTVSSGAVRRFSNPDNDYNVYHSNLQNTEGGTVIGPNDIVDTVDPLAGSLLYLPRIESGSALQGRGATVLKAYGRPGTLWGETGWDELTDQDLWPWPNEEVIRRHFRSYVNDFDASITGDRGFAGDCGDESGNTGCLYGGQRTLTSYIWEYLGHPCPDEICGDAPPVDCTDADGDTYPGTGVDCDSNAPNFDCSDGNILIHPGAVEVCNNGVDDDCDDAIDGVDPECVIPQDGSFRDGVFAGDRVEDDRSLPDGPARDQEPVQDLAPHQDAGSVRDAAPTLPDIGSRTDARVADDRGGPGEDGASVRDLAPPLRDAGGGDAASGDGGWAASDRGDPADRYPGDTGMSSGCTCRSSRRSSPGLAGGALVVIGLRIRSRRRVWKM